nr:DUF433 domain-containing protein [Thermus tenuipuniceus]
MLGKPVVAGTRITVEEVLRRLAAGETPKEVLAAHPRLTPEDLCSMRPKPSGQRCTARSLRRWREDCR